MLETAGFTFHPTHVNAQSTIITTADSVDDSSFTTTFITNTIIISNVDTRMDINSCFIRNTVCIDTNVDIFI